MIIRVEKSLFNSIGIIKDSIQNLEIQVESFNMIPFASYDEYIYIYIDDNRYDILRDDLVYDEIQKSEIPQGYSKITGDFLINQFIGQL